jgi:outer membrane protein TolC
MKRSLIVALFLISNSLFAKTVDFDTAFDLTLNNSKELKIKKLSINKAKEDLDEAKGYEFGKLEFAENYMKTNHAGYVFGSKLASREATFGDFGFKDFLTPLGGAIYGASQGQAPGDMSSLLSVQPEDLNNPESRENYETKLVYEIPIFAGFKISSAKDMARLQLMANKAKYEYDEKQLGLEVLKAYNGAVVAKSFIEASSKGLKATDSFVNFAKGLYEEGMVTSIDVSQAQVENMKLRSYLTQAKAKFDMAIAYLQFLTSDSEISDVGNFRSFELKGIAEDNIYDNAVTYRDDLKWMELNKDTMKKKIDFDSAEYYPMVGAHFEYGYNDDSFSNTNSNHDYYLVAVGLKYTLFDGARISSTRERAKIEYNKFLHYYDQMKEGIKLEVKNNYLDYKSKTDIYNEKVKARDLSDEILIKSEEMYKNRLINMSNLLLQQSLTQQARAEAILAQYEQSIALGKLILSVGNSLKDNR